MKINTHVTQVTIIPEGEPLFSEMATTISIDDEAGGPFVRLEQEEVSRAKRGIAITAEEWPALRLAIEAMLENCKGLEK